MKNPSGNWQSTQKAPRRGRQGGPSEAAKLVSQLVSAVREAETLKGVAIVKKSPERWAAHFRAKAFASEIESKLLKLIGD